MKLTKLQRHTAYILMKDYLQRLRYNDSGARFCYIIYNLFGVTNRGFFKEWNGRRWGSQRTNDCINLVLEYFPELLNKKPTNGEWPIADAMGRAARLQWLDEAIQETS